jgi:anion-transporting  ArsA/GET3 family ATPase
MKSGQNDIRELVQKKRVIVCCGSGGVGKTTMSAAIAIRAAMEGKRTIVITIDPAKRLATSLGLKGLSSTPTDLTPQLRKAADVKGKAFAVMPDTTETFERFVKSMAGTNQGLAQRVLKTSIYKIFAKEFSGTNEYMAMEKLYQIYKDAEKEFDLIVLDTPPSANTRIFLEAPNMLASFFDDRIIRWFVAPGSKLVAGGLKMLLEVLEKLTGHGFVSELLEFTAALFELRAQFMANLTEVAGLLHQDDVAFLMVTSPERLSKSDTQDFVNLLDERGYRFWGFVVNRVLGAKLGIESSGDFTKSRRADGISAADRKVLEEAFETIEPLLRHEQEAEAFLHSLDRSANVVLIPEQTSDVHSIESLVAVSQTLAK